MAFGDYTPNSLEFFALIVYLLLGLGCGSVLLILAKAGHMAQFMNGLKNHISEKGQRNPGLPLGFVYYVVGGIWLGMGVMSGAAFFLIWRVAERLELGLPPIPDTATLVSFTQTFWMVDMVLGVLTLAFIVIAPITAINYSMETRNWGVSVLAQFILFGLQTAACIVFWMDYFLAGLIALFPAVFYLYMLYVVWFIQSHPGLEIGTPTINAMFRHPEENKKLYGVSAAKQYHAQNQYSQLAPMNGFQQQQPTYAQQKQ